VVVAESDEDVLLYETSTSGAVKLDWHTELNDPVTRDYVDGAGFARRCRIRASRAHHAGAVRR
jgi:thiosulfate/3-mercaptopyruvate sulfurtransferase